MSKIPEWNVAAGVHKTVAPPKKRAPEKPRNENETDAQRTQRRLVTEFQRTAAKRRLRKLYDALPKRIVEEVRKASWATRRPDQISVARRTNSSGALFRVPEGWPSGCDPEEAVRDFIAEHFPLPDGIAKTPDEDTWFPGDDDDDR